MRKEFDRKALPDKLGLLSQGVQSAALILNAKQCGGENTCQLPAMPLGRCRVTRCILI